MTTASSSTSVLAPTVPSICALLKRWKSVSGDASGTQLTPFEIQIEPLLPTSVTMIACPVEDDAAGRDAQELTAASVRPAAPPTLPAGTAAAPAEPPPPQPCRATRPAAIGTPRSRLRRRGSGREGGGAIVTSSFGWRLCGGVRIEREVASGSRVSRSAGCRRKVRSEPVKRRG